jgi:chloramphenicol 3-O-phosphotransferase
MIVNGRVEMSAEADPQALNQLMLRYRATADIARLYSEAGFRVICQDVVIGSILTDVVSLFAGTNLHLIFLCPDADTISERERMRAKTGYHSVSVADLQSIVRQTPDHGLWLDTSDLNVEETVAAIFDRLGEARVQV